jgi:hypothetical protein
MSTADDDMRDRFGMAPREIAGLRERLFHYIRTLQDEQVEHEELKFRCGGVVLQCVKRRLPVSSKATTSPSITVSSRIFARALAIFG